MSSLLEFRDTVKYLYGKYDAYVTPVLKFLLAMLTLCTINGRMGYMARIDNVLIALVAALMCSFLPTASLVFFASVFSLAHMYALGLEIALVGIVVYAIMFLLVVRFKFDHSVLLVVTPLLFAYKIPFVLPVAVGLLGGPSTILYLACGVVIHFFLNSVTGSAETIKKNGSSKMTDNLKLVADGIMQNKTMVVFAAAFAVAAIAVLVIRKLSIDYAWTIAMIAGVLSELGVILMGDLIYDIDASAGLAILGAILALVVGKVLEFFRFCVDYGHTEKVQFEDDEYYYYVKAVPKMTMETTDRAVKRSSARTNRQSTERTRSDE